MRSALPARKAEAAEAAEADAETQSAAEREFSAARRYSGKRVSRSGTQAREPAGLGASIGQALGNAVMKELQGTTGRRIVRGILGGLFKGR